MLDSIINKYLLPQENYIHGFARLEGLLDPEFKAFPYGISIGRKLDDAIVDSLADGPTLEYYHHYNAINRELEEKSQLLCAELEKEGIHSLPIVPTLAMSGDEFKPYFEKLRYKLSHKMVATRAGLGWIGKTDLLISKAFGPRLRLTSILVDRPLAPLAMPIDKSRCGSCQICVDACPAQAANGKSWDIHTDRDEFFDPFKCREKCGELARLRLNVDMRICGICVAVCPLGVQKS